MRVCSVDTSGRAGQFAVVSAGKDSPPEVKVQEEEEEEVVLVDISGTAEQEKRPTLKAVSETTTSVSSSASQKKGRKKNKKKQNSNSSSRGASSGGEELQTREAVTREATPRTEEMAEPLVLLSEEKAAAATKSTVESEERAFAKMTSGVVGKPEVADSSDEFVPARRGVPTTEEEEEDGSSSPSFVVREEEDDDEEEEVRPDASEAKPPTGWLSELLGKSEDAIIQGIATSEKKWEAGSCGKDNKDDNSSEDDFDFRPAFSSRKQKKRQQKHKEEDGEVRSRAGSFADSESSLPAAKDEEEDTAKSVSTLPPLRDPEDCKEGWSFEADDLDVNRLIDEVVGKEDEDNEDNADANEDVVEEEKTPLEDVFKFDSELALSKREEEEEEEDEEGGDLSKKKSHSLENLENALAKEKEAEGSMKANDEAKTGKMATSLNVTFDEDNLISCAAAKESLTSASSAGHNTGGNTSESSVGSSPNPKKSSKGKKKKKRRGF